MRPTLLPALALLLLPAAAAGQQADVLAPPFQEVVVVEPAAPLTPATTLSVGASTLEREIARALDVRPADEAMPAQEGGPTTREWWYLVGAIVAGGIILAILL